MYVSRVAASLIQHFPESLKDMMIEDEDIMNQIYSLLDDDHFSPQYWLKWFGFMFSNATCFNIIFTGVLSKYPSFCDYLRNHNEILELLYPRLSSSSISETLAFMLTVEDSIWIIFRFCTNL